MPNQSGNSGGVSPQQSPWAWDWGNINSTSSWAVRRDVEQAETLAQSVLPSLTEAEIQMQYADEIESVESVAQAAADETFALASDAPVEAAPLDFIPADVDDSMRRHESDTPAIRHFRDMAVSASATPDQRLAYREVLNNLVRAQRTEWNANGGSIPRMGRSRTGQVPAPPGAEPLVPPSQRRGAGTPRRRSSFADIQAYAAQPVAARQSNDGQTFFGNIPETSTMTTVASHFGMRVNYPSIEKHPLIVGTHLAGVEIELENITADTPSFRYWTAKGDGSLRNNGMEFVCSHPWGGADLYNAAVEIDGFLFGNNPDTTWRCSTHVHIDVRDLNVAQVKKMILAYVFYERVLFKCSGWQRYKNNFCAALGFAQGQLEDLGNWWADNDAQFLSKLSQNWDKYTAINFLPMGNFGSIEFRISEAKWHKGQLIRLANRFLSLKEVAVAQSDMSDEDFLRFLASSNPTDIIKKGIPKGLSNIQDDLEVGFKLANDILSLAKLRRRSRTQLRPVLTDGSRVVTQPRGDLFLNGYNHTVSHIVLRYLDIEMPDIRELRTEDGQSYVFTFKFLWEMKKRMDAHAYTWEVDWFLPRQNRSQLQRLFATYCAEQQALEPPTPRRRRRDEEPDWEEVSDEEDHNDDVQW